MRAETAAGSSPPPQRVYLVGFMGSGKTAVGEELARRLGWPFVDLDLEVERTSGRTVAEIFRDDGEEAFRELEHRCLAATGELDRAVVATGGGAFTVERNVALVRRLGTSVHLDADFDLVVARLAAEPGARQGRPLFADVESARELHRKRLPAYRRADLRVAVGPTTTPRELAARIAASLRRRPCDT